MGQPSLFQHCFWHIQNEKLQKRTCLLGCVCQFCLYIYKNSVAPIWILIEFDTQDLLISRHIPDFDKIRKQHIK
jgi:hypothetical protein